MTRHRKVRQAAIVQRPAELIELQEERGVDAASERHVEHRAVVDESAQTVVVESTSALALDHGLAASGSAGALPLVPLVELAQAGSAATGPVPTAATAPAFNPAMLLALAGTSLIIVSRGRDPVPELTGKVIDGYLAGATVFVDVNGNDRLDAGEPSTTTDATGGFLLRTGLTGPIVAQGGRDISTNLEFEGVLRAPAGSTVVTPLTTLVAELVEQQGLSVAAASTQVMNAIGQSGLVGTIDLTRFDPVAEAAKGRDGALALQKAGVAVLAMVTEVGSALAPGAGESDFNIVSSGVYSLLARQIADGGVSIAPETLSAATDRLIDAVLSQSEPIGQSVTVDKDRLIQSRIGLTERLASFEAQLESSMDLQSLANAQKSALGSKSFTLQLLHFSDAEAGLIASQTAPLLAAMVDRFEDQYPNSITLAGGDNFLPGPFLAGGTDEAVRSVFNAVTGSNVTGTMPIAAIDIAIHNLIGVQASAVGNHEFDLGSNVLATAIGGGSGFGGAQFPYISSNLDVSADSALSARFTNTPGTAGLEGASTLKGRLAPSAVIELMTSPIRASTRSSCSRTCRISPTRRRSLHCCQVSM
jgi:hypothetical protein